MFTLLVGLALAQPLPAEPEVPVPPEAPEVPAAPPEIPAAPRFEGDGELSITGPANDVFGMGGMVSLDGPVDDNAFLMGGEIHVVNPVHGDLFATGGEISIDAPVDGDVYAFGGEIAVGAGGSIGGHLIAFGGEVSIEGPIGGSLSAGSGRVTIAAPIGGDVRVEAGELAFGAGGTVGGDLQYSSAQQVAGLDEVVDGEVRWIERVSEPVDATPAPEPGWIGSIVSWSLWTAWEYVAKLLVGAALLLVGGRLVGGIGRELVERPSESLGWGLVVSFALPLISTVAIALILPFPLGLVGYGLFALGLYLAQLIAAQALGDWILRSVQPGAVGSPVVSLAVGLAPLVLLMAVPWVGFLAWYLATILGFGAVWLRLRELAQA